MDTTILFLILLVTNSLVDFFLFGWLKVKDLLFVGVLSAFIALMPLHQSLSVIALTLAGALALAVIFPLLFHILGKYTDFFETVLIGRELEKVEETQ